MAGRVTELAVALKAACARAPKDRRVACIHLFGIEHSQALLAVSKHDVAEQAGLPRSYGTELAKGAVLGNYVTITTPLA